jgi:citrate synthase
MSEKNKDQFEKWSEMAVSCNIVDKELYPKFEVKRGLRDVSGKGVLAGLTRIGEVHSYIIDEGETIPVPGRLIYRGIDIEDLVEGFVRENRHGFEETVYLLLFGELPNRDELTIFENQLIDCRALPDFFVNDMIMKAPSKDIMNVLARSVLTLYSFDDNPDDLSIENLLRQSLWLISQLPLLAVYGYQAYAHYHGNDSLFIHSPNKEMSIAENILYMLRSDNAFTSLEAELLDLSLVLHAEHGGGNNSTFTTHVVSSSGTDTYSAISAAIGSLKGPRHGGANIKVTGMIEDLKEQVTDWNDDGQIVEYLEKLLKKEAYDQRGLIYGIGHAVYSVSDPRAVIFKGYVKALAHEKGKDEEYALFDRVERLAPSVIANYRKMYKGVSANVDFYSGFVYRMLGIPEELYTPLFAVSRVSGWCAHRIEEVVNQGKIIRPAYKSVAPRLPYIPMDER